MRILSAAIIALTVPAMASAAFAEAPVAAPATPAAFTVEGTEIGVLLADAGAKAVLLKHLPDIAGNDQFQMAGSMTLKQIQQFAADQVTDAKLAAIQADFDKLPKR